MFILWWVVRLVVSILVSFFFQAEDGIRDVAVTGVQTCALPISLAALKDPGLVELAQRLMAGNPPEPSVPVRLAVLKALGALGDGAAADLVTRTLRSEERRVGEKGRSRWLPDHLKKK